MFTVYVGLEGFNLDGGFIPKELTILYATEGDQEHDHFVFGAPRGIELSIVDQQTVNWTTRNLHGIHWDEGMVPHECIPMLLRTLGSCSIVCHGSTSANYLARMLPNALITDTSSSRIKLPAQLPKSRCGRRHDRNGGRNCSLAKAIYIRSQYVLG